MIIYLSSFCLFFNQIYAQFPDHYDLEKLGEVEFHNEKYKILRPSLHRIRDHFKDVMTKQKTDLPETKLLMDDSGFRHYWSTLDERKSRKSNDPNTYVNNNKDINNKDINKNSEVDTSNSSKVSELAEEVKKALRQENKPPEGSEAMYLVQTVMFCPYLGKIRTDHYVKKEPAPSNAET